MTLKGFSPPQATALFAPVVRRLAAFASSPISRSVSVRLGKNAR
jgi:hypothetical protein